MPLKFAFFHYPLYSDSSTGGSDTYLNGASPHLEGVLAANNVKIVFTGHAHIYERNVPMAGGPLLPNYITGGGGAALETVSSCDPWDAYAIAGSAHCGAAPASNPLSAFHYLLVSVNGNQVTVTPTDQTGLAFDVQTYSFGSGGDTEAPSNPANLTATATSGTRVDLGWTASTDNVGVAGYDVYRNGTLLASVGGTVTAYADTSVAPSTSYSYTVKARDAVGNTSGASNPASITTPPPDPILTFSPTDDTYVQASAPDVTAGSDPTISVDNSPINNILLKFNVSGLAGRQVTGAKLRLYDTNPSAVGGDLYRTASNGWSEATATWNNAPATSGSAIASLGSVAINTWYEVDLSSIVSADGIVSLRVTSTSGDGAAYTSNNGTVGFRPQLVVPTAARRRRPPA